MKRIFAVLFLGLIALLGWLGYTRISSAVAPDSLLGGPRQVVEDFYKDYLKSMGDRASGEFHNPLVEKTYRDLPQLSEGFVKQVDAALEDPQGIAYDPFLCAQDIPSQVLVEDVQVSDNSAVVAVKTDFANHQFTVDLEKADAGWMITAIHCK